MGTPLEDQRVFSSMINSITFNMGTQEKCQKVNEIIASSTLYDNALDWRVTGRWIVILQTCTSTLACRCDYAAKNA